MLDDSWHLVAALAFELGRECTASKTTATDCATASLRLKQQTAERLTSTERSKLACVGAVITAAYDAATESSDAGESSVRRLHKLEELVAEREAALLGAHSATTLRLTALSEQSRALERLIEHTSERSGGSSRSGLTTARKT